MHCYSTLMLPDNESKLTPYLFSNIEQLETFNSAICDDATLMPNVAEWHIKELSMTTFSRLLLPK